MADFRFKRKRKIPGINSSSSADIAFLLLIFFLVTTSLEKTTGIYRKLPLANPEEAIIKKEDILKRNLLTIYVTSENQIKIGEKSIDFQSLKDIVSLFIENPENKEDLPEKNVENIPLLGTIETTKNHIIVLRINENASYETYIQILGEIIKAYEDLREKFSIKTFGKSYKLLNLERKEAVKMIYPQRISEIIVK